MKTLLDAEAKTRPTLNVRTQLQAGAICQPSATRCVSRQNPAWFDSCRQGQDMAGARCFAANVAHGIRRDDAWCEAC
jgi:hypothetical protein